MAKSNVKVAASTKKKVRLQLTLGEVRLLRNLTCQVYHMARKDPARAVTAKVARRLLRKLHKHARLERKWYVL